MEASRLRSTVDFSTGGRDYTGNVKPEQLATRSAGNWAFAGALLHVVAGFAMLLFLRPGLPPTPYPKRIEWLIKHGGVWRVAWVFWILTAVTLAVFLWRMHVALKAGRRGKAAVACATVGLVPDLAAMLVYVVEFPNVRVPLELRSFDAITAVSSGAVANGLYTVAWGILAWSMLRTPWVPRRLPLAAVPGLAAGLTLTVCSSMQAPTGMIWSTAAAFVCFIAWSVMAGLFFWQMADAPARMSVRA
jgi:hypothetical protein